MVEGMIMVAMFLVGCIVGYTFFYLAFRYGVNIFSFNKIGLPTDTIPLVPPILRKRTDESKPKDDFAEEWEIINRGVNISIDDVKEAKFG